jgi:tripartite-type tricarboxylate transporter receptor subunit TctC
MTNVAYKGGGQSQFAVISGEIQLVFGTATAALELVRARKLKALAVSTDTRSEVLPGVPTLAEAANLPGFNESAWNGLLAPAGTPRDIIARLHTEISAVMKAPGVAERLAAAGVEPMHTTPEEFAAYIESETARYAKVVNASGARVD